MTEQTVTRPSTTGAIDIAPGFTVVAIGTKKGLWLASSPDRSEWKLSGPFFGTLEVPSVAIDTREGRTRIFVGINDWHFGPTVVHSDDGGAHFSETSIGAVVFPKETGTSLERVWTITPDTADRPGVVWAGCEPISVFKSTDSGETFQLVQGLWDHPHREKWGAGFGGPAAHTVVPSKQDDSTVHIAMSTGGVYRTTDGGTSWEATNKGIRADFQPEDEYPEFGQCVHRISADAEDPATLYLQNHGGVYRTRDNANTWELIENGLPSNFGFSVLTHPTQGGTAWVIPVSNGDDRFFPAGKCSVYKTTDGGDTWQEQHQGLPELDYNVSLRDAEGVDHHPESLGIYFGTRGGEVWASANEGESFERIAHRLPDVLSVRAAYIPSEAAASSSGNLRNQ